METKKQQQQHLIKKLISYTICILISLALIHLLIFPLSLHQQNINRIALNHHTPNTTTQRSQTELHIDVKKPRRRRCNYFDGNWVPSDDAGPRYNGSSCGTIKEEQNCMAHGRPDDKYLHWRWKPKKCRLPPFDATFFLNFIRNKHMAFVGDSMARNQLESLLCLLATVEKPELVFRDGEDNKFRRWVFRGYNATVSVFWSPFLVEGIEKSQSSDLACNKLYLNEVSKSWSTELDSFDVVVFSVGHWFLHPAMFYDNGVIIGCHEMRDYNCTQIGFFDVFRKALRTTLSEAIKLSLSSSSSLKFVVVTTFSPSHFEGEWDKFGACSKTEPYFDEEKKMKYLDIEMRRIGVEEVAAADREVVKLGTGRMLKIDALDVTKLAFMRADGHPGPYMYANPFANGWKDKVQNDCVHWCLPGPIDTWNELLLELIRF